MTVKLFLNYSGEINDSREIFLTIILIKKSKKGNHDAGKGNLVQMVVPHTPILTEILKCGLLVVYNEENGVFLSRDPRILFLALA